MGRSPTDTKERLLNTAHELIWKSSYGSVSVDDICKQSNVKKGSFYHYFKSKADLAVAAAEKHYEDVKPFFNELFSSTTPPIERFEKLADIIKESQEEIREKYGHVCGCPFATLGTEMAGQEETIREKIDEIHERYMRYYESSIRDLVAEGHLQEDADCKAIATEMSSYILGQVTMARIQNSTKNLGEEFKTGLLRTIGVTQKP